MPAFYNQPATFGNAVVEDVARFQQLPFFLVRNEVKYMTNWNIFDRLYGDIDWETNQGNIMRGSTPQRSPVGRAFFFPNAITTVPMKDIYQVTESVEQAQTYVHNYESFQFNFIPSFAAFWKTYLQFANKDIVEKISISNNQFIETNMWFNSPYVYLCGVTLTSGAPTQMGNLAGNAANSKTAAWLIALVQGGAGTPGVSQNLRLRDVYAAMTNLQEDLAAPGFEGVKNMPEDNEGFRGRYLFLISSEGWLNFTFDPDVSTLKPLDLNILFKDFKGELFGFATCKINRYPIRFGTQDIKDGAGNVVYAAGTPIAPEIFDATDNKWKPNPYWTSLISAPFEVDWALGADRAKTIKVGPPPKEFASANMSADKFYKLRWNGEVRLTDQVFITNADGTISPNVYGEQLKFISKLTHGYLEGERRHAFPIIVQRARPAKSVS